MPKEMNNTLMYELTDILKSYITEMINERLSDIARKPNAPFLQAVFEPATSFGIIPTLEVSVGQVVTQDGKIIEGYKALLTEMERMRRHGFTEGEWERAKSNILSGLESQYNSRDDRRHSHFANRYMDNFREGTPIYDAETEYQLDKQLVEMISCDMVNATVKQMYEPLKNVVIVANSPVKDGVAVPTEAELVGTLKAAVEADVEAFQDNVVKEPLISNESALKGSKVKKSVKNESLGFTEWTLANGIKVVIKQTPYQADNIGVEAISEGGAAVFGDDMYYSAQMLGGVMSASGISKFSASDLRKQLSGKTVDAGAGVGNYEHMVTASAALKDVETMFQLLYLQFTAPRFSEDDFATLMNRYNSMLANQLSNPDFIFSQNLQNTFFGNNYRRQQLTPEILQSIKLEHMAAIHKQLFSNAADFRFTFIGNMSEEQLKPLVEKYIGSLPTAKKPGNVEVNDKVAPVKGGVVNDFRTKMEQPKVSVFMGYSGSYDFNMKNQIVAKYLSAALNNRYLKSIREEKGGTYGVSARVSLTPRLKEYQVQVQFDTNEEMADELMAIVVAEIEKIAKEGPLAEDLDKAREYENKNYTKQVEQNSWWSNAIYDYYKYNINDVEEFLPAVNGVTAADVQALAKKILADGNIVKVVMRPEK